MIPDFMAGGGDAFDGIGGGGPERGRVEADARRHRRRPVLCARDVAGQRDVDGAHPRRTGEAKGLADLAFGAVTVEGDRLLRERPVDGIEVELLVGRVGRAGARQGRRDGHDG